MAALNEQSQALADRALTTLETREQALSQMNGLMTRALDTVAGLDAEDASRRLQPVVATMTRAVQRFNGVIIRTLGDGVKASFGAPQARENHALLACKAAIALAHAASTTQFVPPKSSRFAMRPATTLPSNPGKEFSCHST